MRIIPIAQYNELTMQLAKPVYDRFRRILLAANTTIHPKYLQKMKEIGIRSLFVEDAQSRGITMDELIDMPTWMDVIQVLSDVYAAVKAKKALQLARVHSSVAQLIAEVKRRPIVLPIHTNAMPDEIRPYGHAVNVALLALQIGKNLGYNEIMLRDLGIGCLLHDIGKAAAADERKHPEEGFAILRGIRELNLLSAHVAFQHHETLDGKGYPRAISGAAFHEYAQICGLCNVYENMTTAKDMPSHEVMEYMMTLSGTGYSPHIVDMFTRSVPSYPPGTMVQMNDGKNAIVVKISAHMQRPSIRYLDTGEEISLADHPTVMVAKTVVV
ncbi:HD-GYP domain-containing protein [Paenibacillus hamazuiensis]|uniref:HD-GYP domain-containing protein n=1 Tax=Paenibacillus hamazuiensis TaxID=2936508 RepID=UPI00200FDFBB|nr:HD domain-containing protein [Paenibacillus hamazuiensis]